MASELPENTRMLGEKALPFIFLLFLRLVGL